MARIHDECLHFSLNGLLSQEQIDLSLVCLLNGRWAIVHLQEQMTSWLSHMTNGRWKLKRRSARHPTAKQKLLHLNAVVPKTLVAGVGIGCIQLHRLGDHLRIFCIAHQSVMVNRIVAWSNFNGRNFSWLSEPRRNDKHLVLIIHVPQMSEWFRHAQDEVGLSDLASLRKIWQPRIVVFIPLLHPLINPRADERFLFFSQKPLSPQRSV